jgi:hypothetical protein
MSSDDLDTRPAFGKSSFRCPHCGVVSQIEKHPVIDGYKGDKVFDKDAYRRYNIRFTADDFFTCQSEYDYLVTKCTHCGKLHFWENCELVYPSGTGIPPVADMPEDVKEIFDEAQRVTHVSPRSACALLRICVERIAAHVADQRDIKFGERERLYDKILKLNLPSHLQEICDACRFAGNENAHTGELDMSGEDTEEIAYACSFLVNALVQLLISPAIQADRVLRKLGKR